MNERDEFERATATAKRLRLTTPAAVSAHYDRRRKRVFVRLSSGLDIGFAPADTQGLEAARPAELTEIEITPSGFGLHFPRLDADVYLPGLLEGHLGSASFMAARLGQRGGKARSLAKSAASRANGKRGGRPRKPAKVT